MLEKIELANRIAKLKERGDDLEARFAKEGDGGGSSAGAASAGPAASGPTASDVHVPAAMGSGKKKGKKMGKEPVKKDAASGCGEFVGGILHAATVTHIMHLQTRSYAEHMALGELYAGLPGLIDSFAEACQGRYGEITNYPATMTMPQSYPLQYVRELASTVRDQRARLPQDTQLQNIVDEIVALIDGTAYKLAFLS